jgi:hypothetical protein
MKEDVSSGKFPQKHGRSYQLTLEDRNWISALISGKYGRVQSYITEVEAREKCDRPCSSRTIGSATNGSQPDPIALDFRTLESLLSEFGKCLEDLPSREHGASDDGNIGESFDSLARLLSEIDQTVIPAINSMVSEEPEFEEVQETLLDLLDIRLQKKSQNQLNLIDLSKRLHNPATRERLSSTIPQTALTVHVRSDLSQIIFQLEGEKPLVVDAPELFWDCHCFTPVDRKKTFRCPIHKPDPELANKVRHHFINDLIRISHREVDILWRYGPELFPPSIDSFHMLSDVMNHGGVRHPTESVLDIGSGTGFLGILFSLYNHTVNKLTLNDWLLTPMLYGLTNWEINVDSNRACEVRSFLHVATPPPKPPKRRYDVVLCNPPYLPLIAGYKKIGKLSTVSGTDLLEYVIQNARSLGKRVYLQFSNLARNAVKSTLEKTPVRLEPIGPERRTPFRLEAVWEHKDYIKALEEHGLETDLGERHPFWHKIQTYCIE